MDRGEGWAWEGGEGGTPATVTGRQLQTSQAWGMGKEPGFIATWPVQKYLLPDQDPSTSHWLQGSPGHRKGPEDQRPGT